MRKMTRSGNRQLNAHHDHKRQMVIIFEQTTNTQLTNDSPEK